MQEADGADFVFLGRLAGSLSVRFGVLRHVAQMGLDHERTQYKPGSRMYRIESCFWTTSPLDEYAGLNHSQHHFGDISEVCEFIAMVYRCMGRCMVPAIWDVCFLP